VASQSFFVAPQSFFVAPQSFFVAPQSFFVAPQSFFAASHYFWTHQHGCVHIPNICVQNMNIDEGASDPKPRLRAGEMWASNLPSPLQRATDTLSDKRSSAARSIGLLI